MNKLTILLALSFLALGCATGSSNAPFASAEALDANTAMVATNNATSADDAQPGTRADSVLRPSSSVNLLPADNAAARSDANRQVTNAPENSTLLEDMLKKQRRMVLSNNPVDGASGDLPSIAKAREKKFGTGGTDAGAGQTRTYSRMVSRLIQKSDDPLANNPVDGGGSLPSVAQTRAGKLGAQNVVTQRRRTLSNSMRHKLLGAVEDPTSNNPIDGGNFTLPTVSLPKPNQNVDLGNFRDRFRESSRFADPTRDRANPTPF